MNVNLFTLVVEEAFLLSAASCGCSTEIKMQSPESAQTFTLVKVEGTTVELQVSLQEPSGEIHAYRRIQDLTKLDKDPNKDGFKTFWKEVSEETTELALTYLNSFNRKGQNDAE
jgi:hypothetical protein